MSAEHSPVTHEQAREIAQAVISEQVKRLMRGFANLEAAARCYRDAWRAGNPAMEGIARGALFGLLDEIAVDRFVEASRYCRVEGRSA